MKQLCILTSLLALLAFNACIKNDIPYPTIPANITALEVDGQIGKTDISEDKRQVTVVLEETTNLKKVKIERFEYTPEARITPPLGEYVDLTSPLKTTLSIYQDYEWTIVAKQNIERYVTVENQVGNAEINVSDKSVLVYVADNQDLAAIKIEKIKLGPSSSVISPDPSGVTDFTTPKQFTVKNYDVEELWTVKVFKTAQMVITQDADAWALFAYLNGDYSKSLTDQPTFEFKRKSESSWSTVPQSQIEINRGSFRVKLTGVSPNTTYVFKAVCGAYKGQEKEFTTEDTPVIPNMDFESWYLDSKIWYPFAKGDSEYWMTGNKGVTILYDSNTTPTDDSVKGKAARMESIKITMIFAPPFGAGSIFTGTFAMNGLKQDIKFGRPYTGRPTALKGYYKYQPKIIDVQEKGNDKIGQMDQCHIYMRLEDWGTATVRPADAYSIAYGELKDSKNMTAYEPFEIKLNYTDRKRKPTHITIVATSSVYGEDFTGGVGSVLYLDELSFGFQ